MVDIEVQIMDDELMKAAQATVRKFETYQI